jgi:hypothetical protein
LFPISEWKFVLFLNLFFFLKRYEERNIHNMLLLILNPRFKNLCLISFFISREKGVVIVEKYDRHFLYFIHVLKLLSSFISNGKN